MKPTLSKAVTKTKINTLLTRLSFCLGFSLIAGLPSYSFAQDTRLQNMVEPASTLGEQCIDTPPFDDNYGFNGSCSCILVDKIPEEGYQLFGRSVEASDNHIAVGTSESAGGCHGTGTINVYELADDNTLRRQDEVVSGSLRSERDGFGGAAYAISDNYMAASATYRSSSSRVEVFKRQSDSWVESYTLESPGLGSSPTLLFHNEDLFVAGTDRLRLQRLRASDGTVQQTFEKPDPGSCLATVDVRNNMLSLHWDYCALGEGTNYATLYQLNNTGNYIQIAEIANPKQDAAYFIPPAFSDNLYVLFTETEMITVMKGSDGVWRDQSRQAAVENTNRLRFELNQNEIFIFVRNLVGTTISGYSLKIYSYTPAGGWQFDQTLYTAKNKPPTFAIWGDRITIVDSVTTNYFGGYGFSRFESNGLDNSAGRESRDLPASVVPEVIVYERDSNSEWQRTYSQTFPGGGNQPISGVIARENNSYIALSETGFLNVIFEGESDDCDYSNAAAFDGWGWNPVTMQSCAPLSTDTTVTPVAVAVGSCDYSNADRFGGWGWNETTRESCVPLTDSNDPADQVTAQVPAGCDYSNAALSNGWGWNETTRASCAPLSEGVEDVAAQIPAGCDYSNAALSNGWGWNETARESCAPL